MRIYTTLFCLQGLLLAGCQAGEQRSPALQVRDRAAESPNIVVIVADDLGYCDSGFFDCGHLSTPHIDSLARDGLLFTNAYVTSAMCSPSRAALVTGRYQQRFGFEFAAGGLDRSIEQGLGLPVEEETFADLLSDQGYVTGMIGKWHLGMLEDFHPLERGFDEFFGFLFAGHPYINDPKDYDLGAKNVLLRNHEPVLETDYLTDAFSREAVDFVQRHRDEKFFLYLSYNAPHAPFEAEEADLQRFAHIEDELLRTYAAMVGSLDDGIGDVLQALESNGIGDDTLVWLISDNGCAFFHRVCSSGPLRLGKFFLFEGGIRVPMAVRWPGGLGGGQVFEEPVSSLDILPTLAALAGATPPEASRPDGVDLLHFLRGERTDPPHEALFWRSGPNRAVRSGSWKLLFDADQEWLFHLGHDIGETENLARERPETVERLRELYLDWEAEMTDPLWPGRHVEFPPGQLPPEAEGVEVHI